MNSLLNEPSTVTMQSPLVNLVNNLVEIGADRYDLSMVLFKYIENNKESVRTNPQLYEMVKDSAARYILLEIPAEIDLICIIECLTNQEQTERKEKLMNFSVSLLQLLHSLNS